MDILARVQQAGVTGSAEAGLPLHRRLARKVDWVIANGVECEPLAASDRAVLLHHPEEVWAGLALAAAVTDAAHGAMALSGADAAVLRAVEGARGASRAFPVVSVGDHYPAGHAAAVVRAVVGHALPPGVHPEDTGVMVLNVQTLRMLAQAVAGQPMTHRLVTVAGLVKRPGVVNVPLGASLEQVLEGCGGTTHPEIALILGGPLRGTLTSSQARVNATTHTVLVLPADHDVVTRRHLPLEAMLARAASACTGCRMCSDRCPQALEGYAIAPHRLMRGLVHRLDSEPEVVLGASSCISCGLCQVVCPAGLSPGRLYQAVASDLRSRGFQALPARPQSDALLEQDARRIGRDELTRRLGLETFAGPLAMLEFPPIAHVTLALAGAEPTVHIGQAVQEGTPVAEARGTAARVFASISGHVTGVSPDGVVIQA